MINARINTVSGLLVGLVFLVAPYSLFAAEYEQGREAYLAANYDEAVRIWRTLAENGDARAQFSLGQMYLEGLGIEQNDAASTRWFKLAAKRGLASAQFNLGNAYKHGRGVRQDDLAAAAWWRRAAEQELAPAQFNLAMLYTHGRGVPEDHNKARYWYGRAAANGHAEAKQVLAALETGQRSEAVGTASLGPTPEGIDLRREDWILAQDSLHYTVQVIASHLESSLTSALSQYDFGEPLAYFRFSRQGEPWYAAVYGVFGTHAAAQAAADRLPLGLRKNSPWIRQFGAVQALIRSP